jgi:hypothetical protein
MANLRIDIASEFTGKPAFSKAGKATDMLGKQAAKLGGALAAAFSVQKIEQFAKASINAFLEDEKAAGRLAKVVDNLGLGFANTEIADFVDKLTLATGVSDGKLRPALQALITTTGSVADSQKLLKQAIDISAGSGVDLTTVAQDLANAYVGNTKGLKKYNIGLTQAEIKAASFEDIMAKLNGQFGGSQAAYLETYAGKLDVIKNAAGEAQEIIGEALVDALATVLDSTGGVDGMAESFANLAEQVAGVVYVFTDLYTTWKAMKDGIPNWLKKIADYVGKIANPLLQAFDALKQLGILGADKKAADEKKAAAAGLAPASQNQHLTSLGGQIDTDKARKAAEAAAKKRALELARLQKGTTAELKKQSLAKKQQGLFDLQQIQLVAALKGQLSDDERDKIKLQLALLQGNESEAARLTQKIANSIDATGKLAQYLRTLPDAKNPFAGWKGYLDEVELQAKRIAAFSVTTPSGTTGSSLVPLPPSFKPSIPMPPRVEGGPTVIKVEIDGKEVATAVQNQNNSGNKTGFSRLGDFLTL